MPVQNSTLWAKVTNLSSSVAVIVSVFLDWRGSASFFVDFIYTSSQWYGRNRVPSGTRVLHHLQGCHSQSAGARKRIRPAVTLLLSKETWIIGIHCIHSRRLEYIGKVTSSPDFFCLIPDRKILVTLPDRVTAFGRRKPAPEACSVNDEIYVGEIASSTNRDWS